MRNRNFFLALLVSAVVQVTVFAQTASVRVVRDLDFIAGADYAENRDKLDTTIWSRLGEDEEVSQLISAFVACLTDKQAKK